MSSSKCFILIFTCTCVYFLSEINNVKASRILIVAPTPMHSHQSVFRIFSQELVRRGHHVTVLTPDPAFPPDQTPQNLTEIDLHEITYKLWSEKYKKNQFGRQANVHNQIIKVNDIMCDIFVEQINTKQVRRLLRDKSQQFDLVIVQSIMFPALALAHIYRAPAILMSTLGEKDELYEYAGVPTHPILYPDFYQTSRHDFGLKEKTKAIYQRFQYHLLEKVLEMKLDGIIKRDLDMGDIPPLNELIKSVQLQFVNVYPMWEGHRPMTANVVHLGGIHYKPPKDLPADLKSTMDSSKSGVIYMSFGSHADPSRIPTERLAMFTRVFSTLPYDVLWKWKDAPANLSENIKTFSWLPQKEILHHEKLVLFITQGGLQSTDEALRAGVPLLGIPLLTDQWGNVENYERFGIGLRLDVYTFTETQLKETIEKLINDKRYREKSGQLARLMLDRPQTSLDRAVWFAERTIRLQGRHMPTPPPPSTWDGLMQVLLLTTLIGSVTLVVLGVYLYKLLRKIASKLVSSGTNVRRVFSQLWSVGQTSKRSNTT